MRVLIKPKWRVNAVTEQVYHTDKNCQYVGKAKPNVFERMDVKDVPDNARECKQCAGTANNSHVEQNSPARDIQANDIRPKDIDELTPMGER